MRSNGTLLLCTAFLIGGLVPSALAAEARAPDPTARANQTALAAQQALQAAEQEIFIVKGTISKVDSHTGQVEVQTPHGLSTLSFAPDAVKVLKVGQPAVVELVPRQE